MDAKTIIKNRFKAEDRQQQFAAFKTQLLGTEYAEMKQEIEELKKEVETLKGLRPLEGGE